MFASLGFNLILGGVSHSMLRNWKRLEGVKHTAIGFDRVRITREESFKVRDILTALNTSQVRGCIEVASNLLLLLMMMTDTQEPTSPPALCPYRE
jgi:hypothetical protein